MSTLDFDCRFQYPHGFALNFAFAAENGVTALVGPSGAGKTTILNLIAGLLRPQSGKIRLGDRLLFDSNTNTNLSPETRGIGYVFQDYQLFPHLTVSENLRYGQKRQSERGVDFEKTVRLLELNDLLRRVPASLSGGQKQRVAIGRAILRTPQLLLLDEPVSAVHRELRENVLEYLRRVADEFHLPTLLVSHDLGSVAQIANATLTLDVPLHRT